MFEFVGLGYHKFKVEHYVQNTLGFIFSKIHQWHLTSIKMIEMGNFLKNGFTKKHLCYGFSKTFNLATVHGIKEWIEWHLMLISRSKRSNKPTEIGLDSNSGLYVCQTK